MSILTNCSVGPDYNKPLIGILGFVTRSFGDPSLCQSSYRIYIRERKTITAKNAGINAVKYMALETPGFRTQRSCL